jgi:NAD(P)-dependent dehydrogenase (short-subunit alcohol dehydrogenase family)
MRRFDGKAALVTGAASGIGRATALRLASEGAAIHGVDLDEAGLAETASQVQAAGGKMSASRHDLSRRDACYAAVDAAQASLGRLDVLGNIAGISRFHVFAELPEADWNLMLAVNLSAVMWTSQAALPQLVESKGAIVNVASVAGLIGQAYTVAYCATKGGVVQLTRALAMEYIERGVRVNAVAPGGVDTPMNRTMHFPKEMDWKLVKPYMGKRGMAQPAEIAAAIAYLASDEARFVHGAILSIDGGVAAG